MSYKRGDIALVLFPNSDLRAAKRRPVLIVQADDLETGLNQTIVMRLQATCWGEIILLEAFAC